MLVHNAGVGVPGSIEESDLDDWRRSLEVNVIGAVALTRALLPALRQAGGSVIFVNSGVGRTARAGLGAYSASKFALARVRRHPARRGAAPAGDHRLSRAGSTPTCSTNWWSSRAPSYDRDAYMRAGDTVVAARSPRTA